MFLDASLMTRGVQVCTSSVSRVCVCEFILYLLLIMDACRFFAAQVKQRFLFVRVFTQTEQEIKDVFSAENVKSQSTFC